MEKVVVLHNFVPIDAPEDEKDNLVETEAVSQALSELGYEPIKLPFGLNLEQTVRRLKEYSPRWVFNLVESVERDMNLGSIAQKCLNHLKIPYTGNSEESTLITTNKILAKRWMFAMGLPTAPWLSLEQALEGNISFEPPYIIKSITEHASIGLDEDSVVFDRTKLGEAVERKKNIPGGLFVERYIKGREFNISLLAKKYQVEVLPLAEIKFNEHEERPRIVDYKAKWQEDSPEYQNTVRCFEFKPEEAPLLQKLTKLSEYSWMYFKLNSYARIDFRVDEHDQPWILEINTNPGIAPDAGFTAAAKQAGLNYGQMVERIIQNLVIPK